MIESAELLDTVAEKLADINRRLGTDIIFKASFDKANRTSIRSFRGPGIDKGLQMLSDVKTKYGLRLLTDIHEAARWWTCCRFRHSSVARQICWWQRQRRDGR